MNNYMVMPGLYHYGAPALNRNRQMPPIPNISEKSNERGGAAISLPPISAIVGNCVAQQQPMLATPTEMSYHQNHLAKLSPQYHYYVPPPRSVTPSLSSNNGSPDFPHSNMVAVPPQQQMSTSSTVIMDRSRSNYSNSPNSQVVETTPASTPPSACSSRSVSTSTSTLLMPTVFEGQRTGSSRTVTPEIVTTSSKASKKRKPAKRSKSYSPPTPKTKNGSTSATVSAIDELSKLRKQCPVCGKICSRPSTLKTHYLIHTGDTPFKCPWQDCKKSFNVKSNMLRHLKCHERKKLSKATSSI